jgi:hypothetical protein
LYAQTGYFDTIGPHDQELITVLRIVRVRNEICAVRCHFVLPGCRESTLSLLCDVLIVCLARVKSRDVVYEV